MTNSGVTLNCKGKHIARAYQNKVYTVGLATITVCAIGETENKHYHDWWLVMKTTGFASLTYSDLVRVQMLLKKIETDITTHFHTRVLLCFSPVDDKQIKRWVEWTKNVS